MECHSHPFLTLLLSYSWGRRDLGFTLKSFLLLSLAAQAAGADLGIRYWSGVSSDDNPCVSNPCTPPYECFNHAPATCECFDPNQGTYQPPTIDVSHVVPNPGSGVGNANGDKATARFNQPYFALPHPSGNLIVGDLNNRCLRAVAPNGDTTTFSQWSMRGR